MQSHVRSIAVASIALSLLAVAAPARAEVAVSEDALERADAFLRSRDHGRQVLTLVHTGGTYRGHKYVAHGARADGSFVIVYRYFWDEEDETDVAFVCTSQGLVKSTYIERTTAIVQQPYLFANLALLAVSQMSIAAFKDKMTPEQLAMARQLADKADAKGLLEFELKLMQRIGG